MFRYFSATSFSPNGINWGHYSQPQVQDLLQRVHLDRRPGRAEMRPRKDRQTKIHGRRVERIDRIGGVETQSLVDVQSPRLADQSLGQLRVNAPVARLV